MSLNLLMNYEQEFDEQITSLKGLMGDQGRIQVYLKASQDPKEYSQAQTLLK